MELEEGKYQRVSAVVEYTQLRTLISEDGEYVYDVMDINAEILTPDGRNIPIRAISMASDIAGLSRSKDSFVTILTRTFVPELRRGQLIQLVLSNERLPMSSDLSEQLFQQYGNNMDEVVALYHDPKRNPVERITVTYIQIVADIPSAP